MRSLTRFCVNTFLMLFLRSQLVYPRISKALIPWLNIRIFRKKKSINLVSERNCKVKV